MKNQIKLACCFVSLICTFALVSSVVYAGSGSPQADPCYGPPCGLAVQGDAGGTKLSGAITVSFTNLRCATGNPMDCVSSGNDLADGFAILQLKKSGGNYDAKGSSVNIETFNSDLGPVTFATPFDVQFAATETFRCDVIETFFDESCLTSDLEITLKELGVYDETDPDPNNGDFSVMTEIVIAVKARNE